MHAVEAASGRISRVLAGSPLGGDPLQSATTLIERLKAGIGPDPNGLAEDAGITALGGQLVTMGEGAGTHAQTTHCSLASANGREVMAVLCRLDCDPRPS